MKRFYFLIIVLVFSFGFSQNSEIKLMGGSILTDPYFYCPSTKFNLEVSDYASTSTVTSSTVPINTFNSIINNAIGEKDVLFNAAASVTEKFSYPIDLDFNFKFFNKTYTRVVVGSNGRLVFSNAADLDNLNNTTDYIDRTFLSPPVLLPSPQYNRVYKTGDVTREIKMAQIFAGFTKLRTNAATGGYKYKKFDTGTNKGILITFQSVIPHNGTGLDLGPIYTSRIILFDDGRVVLNVKDKTSGSYNAILGMQNEDGDKEIISGPLTNNNGNWSSASGDAYVVTTGSTRTPTYLWELDNNNDGTIDQTSNTRFFTNYTPVSDIEKLSVKITFLETPQIITSQVEFRKIRTPIIQGTLSCSYDMKITPATYDPVLLYTWYRVGDASPVGVGQIYSIQRQGGILGDYFVKVTKQDGSAICAGADESNRLTFNNQKFPALVKTSYSFCDNSASPATSKTINLYNEFYPKYNAASGLEPYEIKFYQNGILISDANAQNFVIPANTELNLSFAVFENSGTVACFGDNLPAYFLSMKNTQTIPLCASATVFNLKSVFENPSYPLNYQYTYTYADGSSAGDGSAVDITKNVLVKTTVLGCSTITTVNFVLGTAVILPTVPMQERCIGNDTNANRFDFNLIKSTLDPTNQYDIKFYNKSDNSEIIVGTGTGANLNSALYFWSAKTGDYIIYAKAINKTDSSCFAFSNDIILRVNLRPTAQSNSQDFLKKPACGVSTVNLTINNVFDLVNTLAHNQIPTLKYFDGSGTELLGAEISQYPISKGIPYVEIQNGACLPPLKLNFVIVNTPFLLQNPTDEILCDDSDGNANGIININIASDNFKQKFTADYQNTTFEFYDGTQLIYTSNNSNDTFNYNISNNKVIRVKVWNSNFCPSESTLRYFVNTSTTIQFSGNTDLCFGENLNFSIQNFGDFSSVKLISPAGIETELGANHSINYSDVEFGKIYKIKAENTLGCLSETSFTPSDENQPKIKVINQTNTSIEVIAEGGTKPYRYYFNGVPQSSNILQNPNQSSYEIQVESATGCLGPPKKVYFIKINNALTPNSDGINDVWKIENLDQMEQVSIVIVDRNGTKVFESKSANKNEWDGKHNGRNLPTSTYWYVVSWYDAVTQKTEQRQGWILLKNRN